MIDVEASIALIRNVWSRRNASLEKEPPDLARYETIIERVKPVVVVETGLHYGGSLQWFARRVPFVVNVELDHDAIANFLRNRHGMGTPPPNGHIVFGDSHEVHPAVEKMARTLADGGPIMVVLDSDHGTECVYGEMVNYCRFVTPGSYLVVEDGILHYMDKGPILVGNWYAGDPVEAIERFLPDHPEFVPDMEIEDMFSGTTNPGGWLRRV
jgi:cephalosporin hydroxylase